jgi:hypothetical protein
MSSRHNAAAADAAQVCGMKAQFVPYRALVICSILQARAAAETLRGELREQCVARTLHSTFIWVDGWHSSSLVVAPAAALIIDDHCRYKLLAQRRFEENERLQQHEKQCDAVPIGCCIIIKTVFHQALSAAPRT